MFDFDNFEAAQEKILSRLLEEFYRELDDPIAGPRVAAREREKLARRAAAEKMGGEGADTAAVPRASAAFGHEEGAIAASSTEEAEADAFVFNPYRPPRGAKYKAILTKVNIAEWAIVREACGAFGTVDGAVGYNGGGAGDGFGCGTEALASSSSPPFVHVESAEEDAARKAAHAAWLQQQPTYGSGNTNADGDVEVDEALLDAVMAELLAATDGDAEEAHLSLGADGNGADDSSSRGEEGSEEYMYQDGVGGHSQKKDAQSPTPAAVTKVAEGGTSTAPNANVSAARSAETAAAAERLRAAPIDPLALLRRSHQFGGRHRFGAAAAAEAGAVGVPSLAMGADALLGGASTMNANEMPAVAEGRSTEGVGVPIVLSPHPPYGDGAAPPKLPQSLPPPMSHVQAGSRYRLYGESPPRRNGKNDTSAKSPKDEGAKASGSKKKKKRNGSERKGSDHEETTAMEASWEGAEAFNAFVAEQERQQLQKQSDSATEAPATATSTKNSSKKKKTKARGEEDSGAAGLQQTLPALSGRAVGGEEKRAGQRQQRTVAFDEEAVEGQRRAVLRRALAVFPPAKVSEILGGKDGIAPTSGGALGGGGKGFGGPPPPTYAPSSTLLSSTSDAVAGGVSTQLQRGTQKLGSQKESSPNRGGGGGTKGQRLKPMASGTSSTSQQQQQRYAPIPPPPHPSGLTHRLGGAARLSGPSPAAASRHSAATVSAFAAAHKQQQQQQAPLVGRGTALPPLQGQGKYSDEADGAFGGGSGGGLLGVVGAHMAAHSLRAAPHASHSSSRTAVHVGRGGGAAASRGGMGMGRGGQQRMAPAAEAPTMLTRVMVASTRPPLRSLRPAAKDRRPAMAPSVAPLRRFWSRLSAAVGVADCLAPLAYVAERFRRCTLLRGAAVPPLSLVDWLHDDDVVMIIIR